MPTSLHLLCLNYYFLFRVQRESLSPGTVTLLLEFPACTQVCDSATLHRPLRQSVRFSALLSRQGPSLCVCARARECAPFVNVCTVYRLRNHVERIPTIPQ